MITFGSVRFRRLLQGDPHPKLVLTCGLQGRRRIELNLLFSPHLTGPSGVPPNKVEDDTRKGASPGDHRANRTVKILKKGTCQESPRFVNAAVNASISAAPKGTVSIRVVNWI